MTFGSPSSSLGADSSSQPGPSAVEIVSLPHFIRSTRDSGYVSPAAALAELIDNAIEAGATTIRVTLEQSGTDSEGPVVTVVDDGQGMSPRELCYSLCFGGSNRYDSREGLGRYGMGLPNSSFSQARRVEVTSRMLHGDVWTTHLDLDDIVSEGARAIPFPRLCSDWSPPGGFGTRVRWTRCDRLASRTARQLQAQLVDHFQRTFRRFIWEGLKLEVNGQVLRGVDPLMLDPRSSVMGARAFGEPLVFPVSLQLRGHGLVEGSIHVQFSELPVQQWAELSIPEKRRLGIVRGAGISLMRARRQVDFGWFFMGEKRKEAYDDWWRCEVSFEPSLDELFGITHTKQLVRPLPVLEEILTPHLERTARALNARVRKAHLAVKSRQRVSRSELQLSRVESRLPPLPEGTGTEDQQLLELLETAYPGLLESPVQEGSGVLLLEAELPGRPLFEWLRRLDRLVVVLNTLHPFYLQHYLPLLERPGEEARRQREELELWFLALARAEAAQGGDLRPYREQWSNVLTELLKVTL